MGETGNDDLKGWKRQCWPVLRHLLEITESHKNHIRIASVSAKIKTKDLPDIKNEIVALHHDRSFMAWSYS
jgi:hypothetical protein